MLVVVLSSFFILIFILILGTSVGANAAETVAAPAGRVSYYRQVLPIFQAQCHGCHQPAKASGGYVMTAFERLLAGGESGSAAIVPGKPDESYLLDMITPADGQAEMPAGKPPLSAEAVALIRTVDRTKAPTATRRGGPSRTTASTRQRTASLPVIDVDRLFSGRAPCGGRRFSRGAVAPL